MGAELAPSRCWERRSPRNRIPKRAAFSTRRSRSSAEAPARETMAPSSLRCQHLEQDGASARRQRRCCHIPDHKRCSFLRAAQGKYATVIKPYVRDLHKSVLLKNTILHLQDPRRGSQETGLGLAAPQGAPPWQETSQGPPAESEGTAFLPMQPTDEPLSAVGNAQARAADVGISMWAPPAFSSPCQDAGQVTSEDSLADPLLDSFLCTASEVLYFWESLQQQEVGNDACLSLAGPRTDSAWPSESAAASPVQEAGAWGAPCHEEQPRDPLPGSFEILASSYVSNIPAEDFFADIDMSEFESILWDSPSNGQPTVIGMAGQAAAEDAPQAEAPPLPGQDASSRMGSLDHYDQELLLLS
ncbi:uncharacterized protein LOC132592273 [Zootoca vivipara]|uniref:uncharacterized protein LOC132592273 n=1 Tax=Zootoca vivipara TaxID=8524 RepID=UPI00293BBF7D|nr:uncharacterized protein LOC132592273 [Zootoca vivipara]